MKKAYPLYDQRPQFFDLRDLLMASANDFKGMTAISYRKKPSDRLKQEISYSDLYEYVRALGTKMLYMGIGGTHCALVGKLSPMWIVSYLALICIGSCVVPLDPEWSDGDLTATLSDADAEFLICDRDLECKFKLEQTKIKKLIYSDTEMTGETVFSLIKAGKEILASHDRSFETVSVDVDAMSVLVYTSGTTGKGKGVMLSERALLANIYGAQQIATLGKKTIGVLPPHHTFGSTIGILAPVCIGCEVYISGGLKYFARELILEQPDNLILVPLFLETFAHKIRCAVKSRGKEKAFGVMTKLNGLLRHFGADISDKVFSEILKSFGGNLKQIISGGAPLSKDTYELFSALGITVLNGYGITECAPLISVNRPKRIVEGSVGCPIPCDSVKIADPDENGEGEICVKGPQRNARIL